jgi:ParB family chromosome partitioning protein
MKKKALGRGIEALIPKKTEDSRHLIREIDIDALQPGRFQPRMNFDTARHEDLVSSIKEKGIMQPLIVRPLKGSGDQQYELIAGERRHRALKELGHVKVPVIIRDVKDEEALELSLIENIQRQELNSIEEAHAYERLINEFGLSQDDVSKAVGKDRSTIANVLRLLKLPLVVQDYVSRGTITAGHARALVSIDDKKQQLTIAERVAKNGLSVREVESLVKKQEKTLSTKKTAKPSDPYLKAAEDNLQAILGTKVSIIKRKKRGNIVIDFYSDKDLNRLLEILSK